MRHLESRITIKYEAPLLLILFKSGYGRGGTKRRTKLLTGSSSQVKTHSFRVSPAHSFGPRLMTSVCFAPESGRRPLFFLPTPATLYGNCSKTLINREIPVVSGVETSRRLDVSPPPRVAKTLSDRSPPSHSLVSELTWSLTSPTLSSAEVPFVPWSTTYAPLPSHHRVHRHRTGPHRVTHGTGVTAATE